MDKEGNLTATLQINIHFFCVGEFLQSLEWSGEISSSEQKSCNLSDKRVSVRTTNR